MEQAGQLLAGISPGTDRLASLGFDPLKQVKMLDNEVDGPDHAPCETPASPSVTTPAPGEMPASPSVTVTTEVDLDALTVLPPAINPDIKSAAAGTADEKPVAGQAGPRRSSATKVPYSTKGATIAAVPDVKAKRREQNRINAARSRQRNKGFIQQLTAQLQASQKENEALRLAYFEMLRLRSENNKLRDFVAAFKAASQGVEVGTIASAAQQQGMFNSFDFSVPSFDPNDPTTPVTAAALRGAMAGAMAQQGLAGLDSFAVQPSVSDISCSTATSSCNTSCAPTPTDNHSFVLPTSYSTDFLPVAPK